MAKKNRRKKSKKVYKRSDWKFPLTKKNLIIAGIGLAFIIVGFALMATGLGGEYAAVDGTWNNPLAVTVAPILLVIGYCVVIPYAIMKYFPNDEGSNEQQQ